MKLITMKMKMKKIHIFGGNVLPTKQFLIYLQSIFSRRKLDQLQSENDHFQFIKITRNKMSYQFSKKFSIVKKA
jgi:hypothetical protein